jgi:hypothetical protein
VTTTAARRKKWRITYAGSPEDVDVFPSAKQAYEFVRALTHSYRANPDLVAQHITVWYHDGNGWHRNEDMDLGKLAALLDGGDAA